MFKKSSPHQTQGSISADPIMIQQMRWIFFIFMIIWLLASMTAPVLSFYVTGNPLSFTLFGTLAPPSYLWYRLGNFLFPKNERDYDLEAMRIERRVQLHKDNLKTL